MTRRRIEATGIRPRGERWTRTFRSPRELRLWLAAHDAIVESWRILAADSDRAAQPGRGTR